ncbi:hypothetical protein BC831DRAFT_494650 [Entophlyctis helioformis]|nr:hypothetical protein BC831DRAFT_494650 [Entophlyctis helioformis]
MSPSKLLEQLQPARAQKPSHASLLFPELHRELSANPELIGSLTGLFVVTVLKKGEKKEEWYMVFQGRDVPPTISQTRPNIPKGTDAAKGFPAVVVEIEDTDIFKFITGGLPGLKAFTEGRVKIAGDLMLAQQLEEVFYKTGGLEKTRLFLEKITGHKTPQRVAKL